MNTAQPGHSETALVIQSVIEDLDPQQILARDLLMERCSASFETATSFVLQYSPSEIAILKEALARAEQPLVAWQDFCKLINRATLTNQAS